MSFAHSNVKAPTEKTEKKIGDVRSAKKKALETDNLKSRILYLQRTVGNQATQRALAPIIQQQSKITSLRSQPTLHPMIMQDEGKTDVGAMQGEEVNWCNAENATVEPGELSQWNEMDGPLNSDVTPIAFVNGGKTGSGIVHYVAGGDGGKGNQGVGDIVVVAPQYDSEDAADAGAEHATAWAWIRPGTGTATVTRSYRGVLVGANTPSYFITAAAAARADVHERLHVASSQSIHDAHIVPLEARIRLYTGKDHALKQGNAPEAAILALQAIVNWNATITAFRTADTTANSPMGTVDTIDIAAPDFIHNYGPRTVAGVNYSNYLDIPPGPAAH